MLKFILYPLLVICVSSTLYAQKRTFVDQKGRELVAELVEVKGKEAVLELQSGKHGVVEVTKFSEEDQKYIQAWVKLQLTNAKNGSLSKSIIAIPISPEGYALYDQSGNVISKIVPDSSLKSGFRFNPSHVSENSYLLNRKVTYGKGKWSEKRVIVDLEGDTLFEPKSSYYITHNDWPNKYLRVGWGAKDGKNHKTFVDHQGEFICDKTWEYTRPMVEGRAFVSSFDQRSKRGNFELIDSAGKLIPVEVKDYEVLSDFNSGLALLRTKKKSSNTHFYDFHYIDRQGQVKMKYGSTSGANSVKPYSQGIAYSGSAVYDSKGEVIFQGGKGRTIRDVNQGYLCLRLSFLNRIDIIEISTGEVTHTLPGEYFPVITPARKNDLKTEAFFVVGFKEKGAREKDNKYGVIKTNGEWILPLRKCSSIDYYNGFFMEKSSKPNEYETKQILYNFKGEKLTEFISEVPYQH